MTEIEKTINSSNGDTVTYRLSSVATSKNCSIGIILIHGLASNMTRWTEFVNNTKLSESVNVVRLDLKGHGKSMAYSRITMRHWCEDIQQIIAVEQFSNVLLVGHSLGAQIAMQFATYYPKNLNGILLIDPVFPSALKGLLGVVRRLRYGLLFLIYVLLLKSKMGFIKKNLPYRDLHELDIKTRSILKNEADSNIADLYMNPFDDLIYIPLVNFFQDMFEVTRKVPDLKLINCAVLCLLSKGATVSDINLTKSFVNQFPNSEIEVIDADHWLLTEKPVESRQAIEKWCNRILGISIH